MRCQSYLMAGKADDDTNVLKLVSFRFTYHRSFCCTRSKIYTVFGAWQYPLFAIKLGKLATQAYT